MGLPDRWLRIARRIGFDAFFAVWQILDEDAPSSQGQDRGEQIRVWVPRMVRYVTYQRRLYIRSLSHLSTDDILKRLRDECGVTMHRRAVQRVLLDARRQREQEPDNPRP